MCDFITGLPSAEEESCRNPFVLRVIQEFSPPSPEARVRDNWQPSTGSFLTLHQQRLAQRPDSSVQAGMTSAQVLHCKGLDNEELAPVLHKKVTLVLGQNPMLRRRKRRQVKEIDLYAEPIPPSLVGKPNLSRANFREVVMRRLSAVQEQKKSLNTTPLRLPSSQSEMWKSEKDILVEMLEKTQKLQLASQQAWNQEREDLEKQLRRLEASFRTQVDTLKQDNDRLRADLAKCKSLEEDMGAKSELAHQLQELSKRHQDREESLSLQIRTLEATLAQYKEGLDKATEELEKKRFLADEQTVLLEAKADEAISALRKELAAAQSNLRDRDEAVKSLQQEAVTTRGLIETLKKKKTTRMVTTQTDMRGEDIVRLSGLIEDCRRETTALKTQKDVEFAQAREDWTKQMQTMQTLNASLKAQLVLCQSAPTSNSQEDVLVRICDTLSLLQRTKDESGRQAEQLTEVKAQLGAVDRQKWRELTLLQAELRTKVEELLEKCQNAIVPGNLSADTQERAKVCIELYTSSLKALMDVAREISPARDSQSILLQADNDRLKKERDLLLTAVQTLTEAQNRTKTLEALVDALKTIAAQVDNGVIRRIEQLAEGLGGKSESAMQTVESLLQSFRSQREVSSTTESVLLAQLQTLLSVATQSKDTEKQLSVLQQQKDKLEDALEKLKTMYDRELEQLTQQYEAYQELVNTERGKLSDNLLKIAESVEYRQDIWEQFQSADPDENLQQVKELAEELERQTQWEIKTLAVLLSRLQDPLQKAPPVDVNAIKEESEEDEEDEEKVESVVVRLA